MTPIIGNKSHSAKSQGHILQRLEKVEENMHKLKQENNKLTNTVNMLKQENNRLTNTVIL
jgi:cell division protein FtsB